MTGVTLQGSNQLPTSDNISSTLPGGRASATLSSFADGQDPTSVDRILRDVRTLTGAGLRLRLLLQADFVRTPTGAGLRSKRQLQVDSARTPTGAGLHLRLRLMVNSIRTPTGAGLRP